MEYDNSAGQIQVAFLTCISAWEEITISEMARPLFGGALSATIPPGAQDIR